MNRALLISAFSLLLSSCLTPGHSDFGCPYSQGVTCRSTRDVYDDTNPGATPPTKNGAPSTQAFTPAQLPQQADRWPMSPWMNLPHLDAPQPLRTPPVVMRIWVASYQDNRGDLHMPGFAYTEIEPRRWAVGEESDRSAQRLVPLDVKGSQAGPAASAGNSAIK